MRQFRRLTVPDRAHPLVRRMFEEMNYQRIGMVDLAERSGVNKNTIKDWKDRSVPQVHNLAACFTVLGLELTVARRKESYE
jgi:DNA-binding phage protein